MRQVQMEQHPQLVTGFAVVEAQVPAPVIKVEGAFDAQLEYLLDVQAGLVVLAIFESARPADLAAGVGGVEE